MRTPSLAMAFLMIVTGVGCVSETTHQKSLDQLGDLRRASADKAESYELSSARTASEIRELRQEQERLTTALLATQQGLAEAQADLQSTQYHLTKEQQTRERAEEQLATLEIQQLPLRAKIRELEARLVSTQVELESARNSHINARARLAVLDQEHTRLTDQLVDSQSTATRTNIALEAIRKDLASEQKTRREAEGRLGKLEHKELQLERLGKEVRRERDSLKERVEDLTNGLESAQQALTSSKARISGLKKQKNVAKTALTKAHKQATMLKAALAVEQEGWTRLQKALRKLKRDAEPSSPIPTPPKTR